MEFYLVYIAEDSMDSACAEDVRLSRVFDSVGAAVAYYDNKQRPFAPDCMQLWRCEFINGTLLPMELLSQCGNQVARFGL